MNEIQYKYNAILPSEKKLKVMEDDFYNFLPELKQVESAIHLIYAERFEPASLRRRSVESIIEEFFYNYNQGKRNFFFINFRDIMLYQDMILIDKSLQELTSILNDIKVFYFYGRFNGKQWYDEISQKYNIKNDLKILCLSHCEHHTQKYKNLSKNYTPGIREKKFLCFNNKPRLSRVVLLEQLLKKDLVKDSFYSYNSYYYMQNQNNSLERYPPLVLNITSDRLNPINIIEDDLYYFENSYFSVITETLFFTSNYEGVPQLQTGTTQPFITEKTYKPILLSHPFIILGVYGTLQALKDYGYKTFSPYIDESYDNIIDDTERLNAVVNEIERLCRLSETELINFTHQIKPIVDFNRQILYNKTNFLIDFDPKTLLQSLVVN